MAIDGIVTEPSLASVLEVSAHAREQGLALIDLVAQSASTSQGASAAESTQAQVEIAKEQKTLGANLSHLRGLHRQAHIAARETKAQTAEARQEVDRLHLQLQNLYYEQRHLQGEIEACESYEHKYQKLPLIPVEEFLAQHPERADDDESALMIARIDHERAEREALEQQRQELLKRKQKLIADNKKRRDDLEKLDKELKNFIDAAQPIQKLFEKVV